ncbi:glycosyl hydrolase family 61-domain-containing protein [Mycena maculata]|uniref:lytic cellulose monooxygenase (C4-dehydrogenating) n=1 Tax=Mycena maculata TaxID=230809 RepID=A0AAD7IGM9_9AGAR|nr:glycosyl hydrolase family 61-domain-containing protein [Mycena maculata]
MLTFAALALSSLLSQVQAHYTFPSLIVGGVITPQWVNVRETNNYQTNDPVTNVTSPDMRCYDSATAGTATTISVTAGSTLGIDCPITIYHPGVVNVYMAQAPTGTDVSDFAGDGAVWFKVYEITAVTNGGTSITFPAQNLPSVSFTLPEELPTGQYLVRMEALALHVAETYGGAQWYIACGQIAVTGGGSGTPGPLVEIPGVYTGYEPGILINIYDPIPATYTQPGPPVWPASGTSSTPVTPPVSSTSVVSSSAPPTTTVHTTTTATGTTTAPPSSGTGAAEYAQCGGLGWTGATACASPFTCQVVNSYYSQCLST